METNTTQMEQVKEKNSSKFMWDKPISEFFWWCSGADRSILRKCPTEYSKYFGIGGTIFFTAAMAMLSGGYAISMVFEDNPNSSAIGIAFGVFWGLLIFNLDRFMVNTMYSDGTHKITKEELKGGIPRLVLACFIGIVISTPIELKIFNDVITKQLNIDNRVEAEGKYGQTLQKVESDIMKCEADIKKYEEEYTEYNKAIQKAYDAWNEECLGTGGSGKRGDNGPHARRAKENYDQVYAEKNPLRTKAQNNKTEAENKQKQYEAEKKELQTKQQQIIEGKSSEAVNGFSKKYIALSNATAVLIKDRETGERKWDGENLPLKIARIVVMLLFIAIEIIPTLFKMMMTSGPYDELLHEARESQKAESIKRTSRTNDEVNTEIQIFVAKNKEKLEAEVAANKEVLSKIAAVQAELLETAIEEWRKEELAKIKADPSTYIKSNTRKG